MHATKFSGSLGPIFLLMLPVGIVGLFRDKLVAALLAGLFLLGIFWSSPLSSYQMRFLMIAVPLGSLLAAESISRLSRHLPVRWSNWSQLAIAGLLFMNLPPFISIHEADREGDVGWLAHVTHQIPLPVVLGAETQKDYLTRKVPSYAAWEYINLHLPPDSRILTFSGGDHYYSNRDRLWSDSILARPAVWHASRGQERQVMDRLRWLGITHILFDMNLIQKLQREKLAIVQPEIYSNCLSGIYKDSRFELFQVKFDSVECSLTK